MIIVISSDFCFLFKYRIPEINTIIEIATRLFFNNNFNILNFGTVYYFIKTV